MKAGLSALLCAALFRFTLSQHHNLHHKHKRETVVTKTNTQVATEDVSVHYENEHIIIYVDKNSDPISTTTSYRGQKEVVQTDDRAIPSSTEIVKPKKGGDAKAPKKAPLPTPSSKVDPGRASLSQEDDGTPPNEGVGGQGARAGPANGGPGFSLGVTYTPYNGDHSCKTEGQITKDLANIQKFQVIRLYGTDCGQVEKVLKVTKGKVSIFAGIFNIDEIRTEVDILANAVNGNWKIINTVSVGNELVNSNSKSVGQVISAIDQARSALKAKGYTGPIVTVDTMIAMKNHPELCKNSDFCAINCHAFFDGNVPASGAGPFVAGWAKQVSQAAGGKTTVVTESGWPTQGSVNNKAIPGRAQQRQAMESLRSSFKSNLIQFGLYNDLWKSDRGDTHGAEKFWGIEGNAPS